MVRSSLGTVKPLLARVSFFQPYRGVGRVSPPSPFPSSPFPRFRTSYGWVQESPSAVGDTHISAKKELPSGQ